MSEGNKLQGERWVVGLAWLACGAAVLLAFAPAASEYFFLFDDFKLVGQALELPLVQLVTQPHFHYFRPLVHGTLSLESAVFGWGSPAGYAWVGLIVHGVNAALYGGLLRRARVTSAVAALAASLFFMAPWSLETLFWASCRFELMACCFALLAGHAALGVVEASKGRGGAWFLPLLLMSCLCKEAAVGLWLGALIILRLGPPEWRSAGAPLVRKCLAGLLVYLGLRGLVMTVFAGGDPLGGHQGNVLVLLAGPESVSNLFNHLGALLLPPVSEAHEALRALHGAVVVVGLLGALWRRPRLLGAACLGALVTLLPALWITRDSASMAGGRLLYMPTLFLSVAIATGWARLGQGTRWRRAIMAALYCCGAVCSVASATHQSEVWRGAYGISRSTMSHYGDLEAPKGPRHIANMPFVMREGPYLLKAYAFEWYGGLGGGHPVTATPIAYEMRDGQGRAMPRWSGARRATHPGVEVIELPMR